MNPKVLLTSLLVLIGAGLSAQTAELRASVDTGLKAAYQNGQFTFSPNAQNASIVGADTTINGTVGVITAAVGNDFYGATVSTTVGAGTSQLNDAWGWYRPLNWMTIAAGSGNPNPFPNMDNDSYGSFKTPGIAAMVDLAPLQIGGVVASQSGVSGQSANLALTGGARLALEGIGTINFIVGTTETIWLEWYHASIAVTPVPGVVLNAGYSAETITGAYLDEGNAGISFGLTPEIGFSGYAQVFDPWLSTGYWAYYTSVLWAVAPGLSLKGAVGGDLQKYPNSKGEVIFTYQPFNQVTVNFKLDHSTNPGNTAVAQPLTEVTADFAFSL